MTYDGTTSAERYQRYIAGELSYNCSLGQPTTCRQCTGKRVSLQNPDIKIACQCECHSREHVLHPTDLQPLGESHGKGRASRHGSGAGRSVSDTREHTAASPVLVAEVRP